MTGATDLDQTAQPGSPGVVLSSDGLGCNAQTLTKERPILFGAPMVRALLDGTKTQTRRVVKGAPNDWSPIGPEWFAPTVVDRHGDEQPGADVYGAGNEDGSEWVRCPYGAPRERLWVKETYHTSPHFDCLYRADYEDGAVLRKVVAHGGWTPSIFMPRRLSRITLEVTRVRVERLHAISEADAWAEGLPVELLSCSHGYAPDAYRILWGQINGLGPWSANPWVWVLEFQCRQNLQPNKV
jgi:hypothetical protein